MFHITLQLHTISQPEIRRRKFAHYMRMRNGIVALQRKTGWRVLSFLTFN
jgi:hypothetical protein